LLLPPLLLLVCGLLLLHLLCRGAETREGVLPHLRQSELA
jgi:hypothetical protein